MQVFFVWVTKRRRMEGGGGFVFGSPFELFGIVLPGRKNQAWRRRLAKLKQRGAKTAGRKRAQGQKIGFYFKRCG